MSRMPSFQEFLGGMTGGDEPSDDTFTQLAEDVEVLRLQESYAVFQQKNEFRPGMLVRQKPLANGYRHHGANDMGIVIEVLDAPVVAEKAAEDPGSPYFRKPMDMIIGHLTCRKEGFDSFDLYHVDSRHYEPYDAPESKGTH